MLAQAAGDAAETIEGVPAWLVYLGGVILTPLVGVLVVWLRRLLRVEEATDGKPPGEAQPHQPQGPAVTQTQPVPPPPPPPSTAPDPEIALIASTMDRLWEQLELTKAQVIEANREHQAAMTEAERRHREAMAAAERRHSEAMAGVMARLQDREAMVAQLRATIDVLTGRRTPE